MNKDPKIFIGKTLKEVRESHPDVRVARAGNVRFVLSADFVEDRLNVILGKENLLFSVVGTKKISFEQVDESTLDNGIVVSAHFG